jgi:hypothetical protein
VDEPITVGFRFDAATPEQAKAVIDAIRAAGLTITANHTHRPKRRDAGVFWDGHISINQT